jgi:formate/nitrite transporter FocA (FNT family)
MGSEQYADFQAGIFAGWLIAMMVWILAVMNNTRLPLILIMTYAIGLGGFR